MTAPGVPGILPYGKWGRTRPFSNCVSNPSSRPPYLPSTCENRATAARVFARQFNALLDETGLKMDAVLQTQRTIYSLRHTAICMRIILSQGKENIFNLAKNAGTSVNQIERFYARNLPLSPDLAKNLQSFGE